MGPEADRPSPCFAHTRRGQPESAWEPLTDHLVAVANCAAGFASAFSASDIARLAGLWHDLGKFAPVFQQYLRDSAAGRQARKVDHSTAGALHAVASLGRTEMAGVLAFVIAGHHAGLADLTDREGLQRRPLTDRLAAPPAESSAALAAVPEALARVSSVPVWRGVGDGSTPLRTSMFIRMVFSCLVDADRLETERATDLDRSDLRSQPQPTVPQLKAALDQFLVALSVGGTGGSPGIQEVRNRVLADCRAAAAAPPGLFTLTAPTGSGKTLSSMAFALAHAERHGFERVIYALPFTSVTEQNAAVFRNAFASLGTHVVLEHHSAVQDASYDNTGRDSSESPDTSERWRQLACENWDARVVVTTNVQFLESLFASDTKRCRKLHRLARSVIIMDEAQSLPVDLLRPTLAAIQELAAAYGSSIVLCSATMPAVLRRAEFPIGLPVEDVREIVAEPEPVATRMRRVDVVRTGSLGDEELADRLSRHERVLAIVNTRAHAARVFALLRSRAADAMHLSALMCPAHRADRVAEMKRRLAGPGTCRVVSTQVVEAGVDIDFPVAYRAEAGLDSIVQAAGRCNREGRLSERGRVFVFGTEEEPPPDIGRAIEATRQTLEDHTDALDLHTIEQFFRLHYWERGEPSPKWDGRAGSDGRRVGITGMLAPTSLRFETASREYRLIDEFACSLVVPYGDQGSELCTALQANAWFGGEARRVLRRAQRFSVSVRPSTLRALEDSAACVITELGVAVLSDPGLYDPDLGLRAEAAPDPARLMV